jgi:hypothetical protein
MYNLQVFNGMQGSVVAIRRTPDEVSVRLDTMRVVLLRREVFTVRDKETGAVVASRAQIPLLLSYAVTGKLDILYLLQMMYGRLL